MNWAEVSVKTTTEGIEILTGFLMAHGIGGLMIEDSNDFNNFLSDTTVHWDYVDEELMKMAHCDTLVKFYLPDNPQGFETLNLVKQDLAGLQADQETDLGELSMQVGYREEEDWETAWKKYYHPIEISPLLVVVPEWEEYSAKDGQAKLLLNPGMAFGTGSHNTTRLCLEFLSEQEPKGLRVLDMGCGSGILSIAALLLGAHCVTSVDIDQLACKIARENAALNGCDDERLQVFCGDILSDQGLDDQVAGREYDLITANIVADVLIAMAPLFARYLKSGGTLLVSGIISERADEVTNALKQKGFDIMEIREENDWAAAVCRKAEEACS